MSMNQMDIASFAESMLTERIDSGRPVQFAAAQAPNAPDVSDVEVPANFTSQVLTEGHWDKANVEVGTIAPAPKRQVSPPLKKRPTELSEEVKVRKELFEEYRKKLGELDEIVQEMTTVGMIGVGGTVAAPGMSVSKNRKKKKRTWTRK